jgi:uncharacterized protein
MLWLFVFGIIHTLFWWADVLHLYAISGVLLLLFRKASVRTILIWSVLCMFVIPTIISFVLRNQPGFFNDKNIQVLYQQYRNGNIIDVFRMNLVFYYKAFIVAGADMHDIVETLGRFLFGYFLLRIKMFESIESKAILFRKVLAVTALPMIVYFVIRWIALKGKLNIDEFYWEPVIRLGIISTTCFYSCVIILAFISSGRNIIFNSLQALGRMTLTNYLLVSAILITILYGIGFRKLGELPMHIIWLIALGWLIVEIVFSTFWLSRFLYGPVEWIWRQLTYRQRLQLKK